MKDFHVIAIIKGHAYVDYNEFKVVYTFWLSSHYTVWNILLCWTCYTNDYIIQHNALHYY